MYYQFYYKIMARAYDLLDVIYFHNHENSPRTTVVACIGEQDAVLDVCCGTGANAARIAQTYPSSTVFGVDISKQMLSVAREKRVRQGIKNLKLYRMDATKTAFKDQCFDKVSISLVLHEMSEELAGSVISEVRRILKDDGELIITEWELSRLWWQRLLFLPIHLIEPKTYRELLKKDLNVYFKEYGFEIIETMHCDYTKVLRLKKER